MCQIQPCKSWRAHPNTAHWKVGKLCPKHYEEIFNGLGEAADNKDMGLYEDLMKIRVLLHYNVERCIEQLGKFEKEMNAAKAMNNQKIRENNPDPRFTKDGVNQPGYMKLSLALEYYEGLCYWPANRVMLAGLLTSEAFLEVAELGLNKDPGAGLTHGEQTHRIQWHVIAREVTNNFKVAIDTTAGWSRSPLDLYWTMIHNQSNVNGILIDDSNLTAAGWKNPDHVMMDVRRSKLSLTKGAIERRVEKHGGMDIQNFHSRPGNYTVKTGPRNFIFYPSQSGHRTTLIRQAVQTSRASNGFDMTLLTMDERIYSSMFEERVAQACYLFEKTGLPVNPPRGSFDAYAVNIYVKLRMQYPHIFKVGNNHPGFRYQQTNSGVIRTNTSPDQGERINTLRILRSRGGFNPQYNYSSSKGANPAPHCPDRW